MTTPRLLQRLDEFKTRALLSDLEEAAKFTKVTPPTVLGWLTNSAPPKGETHLRLMHYLSLRGLHPAELDELPRPAYLLGRYIAFDVLTIDMATRELGYAGQKDLYRLLQGAELTSNRAQLLTETLSNWEEEYNKATPRLRPFEPQSKHAPATTDMQASSTSFEAQHVAGSLLTTAALVESLILSGGNALEEVVVLVGNQRVTDLASNLLTASN